jgi:hypothetical protein
MQVTLTRRDAVRHLPAIAVFIARSDICRDSLLNRRLISDCRAIVLISSAPATDIDSSISVVSFFI